MKPTYLSLVAAVSQLFTGLPACPALGELGLLATKDIIEKKSYTLVLFAAVAVTTSYWRE
jgi:hypothetical protein